MGECSGRMEANPSPQAIIFFALVNLRITAVPIPVETSSFRTMEDCSFMRSIWHYGLDPCRQCGLLKHKVSDIQHRECRRPEASDQGPNGRNRHAPAAGGGH